MESPMVVLAIFQRFIIGSSEKTFATLSCSSSDNNGSFWHAQLFRSSLALGSPMSPSQ